ncbi:MAG: M48 family metalloprotease [Rhodospirillales bacterium]|nr:M48 family metalloprotease [Rhodospirillales bacterium]
MTVLRILPIIAALLLTACATPQTSSKKIDPVASKLEAKKQRELVIQEWTDADERLFRVGYPILVKASSFCEKTSFQTGMTFWTAKDLGKEWEEAYQAVYGLSDLLQAAYIVPSGAAARAGLKSGDIFISVNDWSVPVGKKAKEKFSKKLNELSKSEDPITFTVHRDENDLTLIVTPEEACNYQIVLDTKEIRNAFADGKNITFTMGIMDFFRTDQEVALVFSHELAHNSMGHIEAQKQNMVAGGAGGFVIDLMGALAGINTQGKFTDLGMRGGAGAFSVAFETEADYVGLYIMATAGHEIEKSSYFWRRMSLKSSKSISLATTHPANADRFVGIENTIKEIKAKIAAGEPLEPEMKKTKPVQPPKAP